MMSLKKMSLVGVNNVLVLDIRHIRDRRAEHFSPRHTRGKAGQHAQQCEWKTGKQLYAGNRHCLTQLGA